MSLLEGGVWLKLILETKVVWSGKWKIVNAEVAGVTVLNVEHFPFWVLDWITGLMVWWDCPFGGPDSKSLGVPLLDGLDEDCTLNVWVMLGVGWNWDTCWVGSWWVDNWVDKCGGGILADWPCWWDVWVEGEINRCRLLYSSRSSWVLMDMSRGICLQDGLFLLYLAQLWFFSRTLPWVDSRRSNWSTSSLVMGGTLAEVVPVFGMLLRLVVEGR
jgi:hypothetical protein